MALCLALPDYVAAWKIDANKGRPVRGGVTQRGPDTLEEFDGRFAIPKWRDSVSAGVDGHRIVEVSTWTTPEEA